jgi:hypothetical protein
MTRSLFESWATEVFFPAVAERRLQCGYQGTALLIMDGLGAHRTQRFADECQARGIEILFLVPRSSDQTQPLDLLTFSLMKQRFAGSKFNCVSSSQSNRAVRILGAWFEASAPHHNIEAFMNLGLVPSEQEGRFVLVVDCEHARRAREWPKPGGKIPAAPLPDGARRRTPLPRGE